MMPATVPATVPTAKGGRYVSLDADVSPTLGWTLRNPNFAQQPLTLRHLLSHRSSLTDGPRFCSTAVCSRLMRAAGSWR